MAIVDLRAREVHVKLLIVGAMGAGRSTNLTHLYGSLQGHASRPIGPFEMNSALATGFDYAPPGLEVSRFQVRFHGFVLGGDHSEEAMVDFVQGVDGGLIVVDSAPDREAANLESRELLDRGLAAWGLRRMPLPFVVQYNKRDLPGAVPLKDLRALYNPTRGRACSRAGRR